MTLTLTMVIAGGIVLIFTGKRTHVPGIVIITLPDNVQASSRHSKIELTPPP